MNNLLKKIAVAYCCFLQQILCAQFAPPVGQIGTTAMYKDSSDFIAWATGCTVVRGLQDISNTSGAYASVGDSTLALGQAGSNGVVSLGDGGYAILTFQSPISDGTGNDFAVFENSFSDDYLEFGFVEVSSDGINFFRFPATCNIQNTSQTGSFGLSDASKVNNLGGKYKALYGTPFDLQELSGTPGIDISNITHIKIIDVIGSINPLYATHDMNGNKINDPWPTAFASSGFDLDAIGVIHQNTASIKDHNIINSISVFPNPATVIAKINYTLQQPSIVNIKIINLAGRELMHVFSGKENVGMQSKSMPVEGWESGMYFIVFEAGDRTVTLKLIID